MAAETMMREKLRYREAAKQFDIPNHHTAVNRERIYLAEGAEADRIGQVYLLTDPGKPLHAVVGQHHCLKPTR